MSPEALPDVAGIEVRGISYDSRKVQPGDLFVAVPGHQEDGHRYVSEAIGKRAVAVVGEPGRIPADVSVLFIPVTSSRRALARLSAAYFEEPSRYFNLVGVTGTNGKTTTTYLIEAILAAAGVSPGVIGTVEYRFSGERRSASHTTPESLDLQHIFAEMRSAGVGGGVLEVSSHALELERIRECRFDGAVFTNLSPEHLDFHPDLEAYFSAKRRLFTEALVESGKPDLFAVINGDDSYGIRLIRELGGHGPARAKIRVIDFSARGRREAAVKPISVREDRNGIAMEIETPAGRLGLRSDLIGRYNVDNILGAVGAGIGLNLPPEAISRGVAAAKSVPGRLETVTIDGISEQEVRVVVDYAHTPGALEKVLEAVTGFVGSGRVILVFGCGGDRDRKKRPEMGKIAARFSHAVVLTSDNPRSEDPQAIIDDIRPGIEESNRMVEGKNYWIIPDRSEAIRRAIDEARPGDVVLIAGKGHETYQLIGSRRLSFDDREVARKALEEKSPVH